MRNPKVEFIQHGSKVNGYGHIHVIVNGRYSGSIYHDNFADEYYWKPRSFIGWYSGTIRKISEKLKELNKEIES